MIITSCNINPATVWSCGKVRRHKYCRRSYSTHRTATSESSGMDNGVNKVALTDVSKLSLHTNKIFKVFVPDSTNHRLEGGNIRDRIESIILPYRLSACLPRQTSWTREFICGISRERCTMLAANNNHRASNEREMFCWKRLLILML